MSLELRIAVINCVAPETPRVTRSCGATVFPLWPIILSAEIQPERLAEWVLNLTPSDLPPAGFQMPNGATVNNPEQFLQSLQAAARCGPSHPRWKSGALQSDVKALSNVVGADLVNHSSADGTAAECSETLDSLTAAEREIYDDDVAAGLRRGEPPAEAEANTWKLIRQLRAAQGDDR